MNAMEFDNAIKEYFIMSYGTILAYFVSQDTHENSSSFDNSSATRQRRTFLRPAESAKTNII